MACCLASAYVIIRILMIHQSIKDRTLLFREKNTGTKDNLFSYHPPPPHTETVSLRISGITCAACIQTIQDRLVSVPGVEDVILFSTTSQARITYHPSTTSPENLLSEVEDLGYGAEVLFQEKDYARIIKEADLERERKLVQLQRLFINSIASAIPVLVLSNFRNHFGGYVFISLNGSTWLEAALCGIPVFILMRPVYHDAWRAISLFNVDMSILTSLGILLSYFKSLIHLLISSHPVISGTVFFDSTALLPTIIIGGQLMKEMVMRQSHASLLRVANLAPDTAYLTHQDDLLEKEIVTPVNRSELRAGDRVIVYAGETIPANGMIIKGQSTVLESPVNGEVIPASKGPGSIVRASTRNIDENLIIELSSPGSKNMLQSTLEAMVEAEASKPKVQEFTDRVGAWFVIGVLMAASVAGVRSYYGAGASWPVALERVISVLLCACPCALTLSTPCCVMIGIGVASQNNILLRGGSSALESAASIKTILFDKTGTLTTGCMSVKQVDIEASWKESEVKTAAWLTAVLCTERTSRHPIAQAVVLECEAQLKALQQKSAQEHWEVSNIRDTPGLGVECILGKDSDEMAVIVGSQRYLESHGIEIAEYPSLLETETTDDDIHSTTHIFVSINGAYAGHMSCSDSIRSDARAMVMELKSKGYHVGMVTSGTAASAVATANKIGIPKEWVWADLLPDQKVSVLNEVRNRYGPVAMVGDNLNDIQALNSSDFSIAAFVDESSLTAASSDAILISTSLSTTPSTPSKIEEINELLKIPHLFELSNRTFWKIKQNLYFALAYNVIVIAIGMGILERWGVVLTPTYASLGKGLSSISIILNAMSLEEKQNPPPLPLMTSKI